MAEEDAWYQQSVNGQIVDEIEFVFRKWSGLEGEELEQHLESVRARAWEICKYPCLGMWTFVQKSISRSRHFNDVVSCLRGGGTLLDLGASFGHDLRLLAAHDAPTDAMFALDRDEALWQLGYELFRDHDRMKAKFLHADFFDDNAPDIEQLYGRLDIVIASQFFHLWSWEKQLDALRRCCRLTKPGSLVIGFQRAQSVAQHGTRPWGELFYHSCETFKQIWMQMADQTQTTWVVEVDPADAAEYGLLPEDVAWIPSGGGFMEYACRRVT